MTKPSSRSSNPHFKFVLGSLKMQVNFRFFPKFSIYLWGKQCKIEFIHFSGKYSELKVFIREIKCHETFIHRNCLILPFISAPKKPNFFLKKSHNKKKYYKLKNLAENSLQHRCIKKYYTWIWDIVDHSLQAKKKIIFQV